MNAAGWEKNRISDITSTLPPPVIPNNNPTLIVSGRVVVRNDWVCPSYARNPAAWPGIVPPWNFLFLHARLISHENICGLWLDWIFGGGQPPPATSRNPCANSAIRMNTLNLKVFLP